MQIELLADRPEFIPTLAEWHFREWAYLRPGDSVANRIRILHERAGRRDLKFSRLIGAGLATFGLLLQNGPLILYQVSLTPKGRQLMDAWRSGDRRAVGQLLGNA